MMIAIPPPPVIPSVPQSPAATSHQHIAPSAMTASLAILPSSPLHSPSSLNHPPLCSAAPRRPKLHLNTSNVRTFGRGSSLRLDTLSAISPTVRNTYNNAYDDATASTAPIKPCATLPSPDASMSSASQSESSSRSDSDTPSSASTQSSISVDSAISTESVPSDPPYRLTHNIPSILSNSPIKHLRKRKISRPMFPAPKKVSFRAPLEEEIKTSTYTLAHSDLEEHSSIHSVSRSPSPESSDLASSPTSSTASDDSLRRRPRTGEKRDSSDSDSESDSCPETPVAGRRKRRREWVWTLGPIAAGSTS